MTLGHAVSDAQILGASAMAIPLPISTEPSQRLDTPEVWGFQYFCE